MLRSKFLKGLMLSVLVSTGSTLLGAVAGYLTTASAKAQQRPQSAEKLIRISQKPDDVLRFDDLNLNTVKVVPGRKFSAAREQEAGGWLDHLRFTFFNNSQKRITNIHLGFQFIDTLSDGPLMVYDAPAVGVSSAGSSTELPASESFALEPGETATFTLSDKAVQGMKSFLGLRNYQIADVSDVIVRVEYAQFDDGTRWSFGHFYRPNPNVPGRFERIDQ